MSGLGRRSHYRKHITDTMMNEYPLPRREKGDRIAMVKGSRGGNLIDVDVEGLGSETNAVMEESFRREVGMHCSLALLPTKFNKLVWVKRGDFVIVEGGEEEEGEGSTAETIVSSESEGGISKPSTEGSSATAVSTTESTHKVKYIVKHILFADQVKHAKKEKMWPKCFEERGVGTKDIIGSLGGSAVELNSVAGSTTVAAAAATATATTTTTTTTERKHSVNEQEGGEDQDDYEDEYDNTEDDHLFVNTNKIRNLVVEDSSDSDSD